MIKGAFKFGSDITYVVVDRNNLFFLDMQGTITTIQGLKFSKEGVIKEHPDLKDNPEWKSEAIKRLNNYLKTMKTEMETMNYIKEELIKFGNEPLFFQRAGFRPEKFK